MPLELRARRNTCSISSGSTLFAALCTHLLLYHTINGEAFSKNYRAAHTDQNETWRRNTPTDRTHTTGKCFVLCIAVCNAFHGGVYVCNTRPKALCPAQTPQRHSARDDGSCGRFPVHSHRQASYTIYWPHEIPPYTARDACFAQTHTAQHYRAARMRRCFNQIQTHWST